MPVYLFRERDSHGAADDLGPMLLRGDADAITFAEEIIRPLVNSSDGQTFAGRTLEIVEGERVVSAVPYRSVR